MTALRKITSFEKRFQSSPGHLALALHAAFPLALTPDMLYRLAAYFQEDCQGRPLRIPWIAVADILLSPLCEATDDELYEMVPEVRAELLKRLENNERFGPERLQQLADFLLTYAQQHLQHHNPSLMGRDLSTVRDSQLIIAQANKTPDKAVESLAAALATADLKNNASLIRLSRMTDVVADAPPMQTADGVKQIRLYAEGLEQIGRRNQNAAARRFAEAADGQTEILVGNFSIPIPVQAHRGLNFPDFFLLQPLDGDLIVTSAFNASRPELEFPADVRPNDEGVHLGVRETIPFEGSRRPVIACQRGTIDEVNHDPNHRLGRYLRIHHDWPTGQTVSTWYTWYCFLEEIYIKAGEFVLANQQIAALDSAPNTSNLKLIVQHIGAGLSGFIIEDVVDPEPLIWREDEPPVVDECRVISAEPLPAQPGQRCIIQSSVQNIGNTTWDTGYHFAFAGGEQMDGPDNVYIDGTVEPGRQLEVELSLIAPDNPGLYQGHWQPRTPNGFFFPSALTAEVEVTAEMPTMDGLVVEDSRTHITSGEAGERGYQFEVTWRLRNSGLRPWNKEFSLVRTTPTPLRAGNDYHYSTKNSGGGGGDNILGAELTEIPLPEVEPGDELTLTIPFTAPETDGFFESKWQLFNPEDRAIGEKLIVSASVGPITGHTDLGLFLSDSGEIGEKLAAELPLLKPYVLKILSTVSPAMAHRLAADNPKARWIIRPFAPSITGNPREFLNQTLGQVKVLVDALAGQEVWVEIHSEPNISVGGLGSAWHSGEEFTKWFLEVKSQYQGALGPDVRFIYPGLSAGPEMSTESMRRAGYLQFLEESSPAVFEADAIGYNLEWSETTSLETALEYLDALLHRYPEKPLWVTEANNFDRDLPPEKRAFNFIECWHALRKRPQVEGVTFFLGQSSDPAFKDFAWVGKGISEIVGRRYDDAAGCVEDVRLPLGGTAGIGKRIIKTWRIQNIGRTTWNSDYRLALVAHEGWQGAVSYNTYISGHIGGGGSSGGFGGSGEATDSQMTVIAVPMPELAPGEIVTVNLSLDVPNEPGSYSQTWQLMNVRDEAFGERWRFDVSAVEPGTLNIETNDGILNIFADGYAEVNGNIIGRNHIITHYHIDGAFIEMVDSQLEELFDDRLRDLAREIYQDSEDGGYGGQIRIEGSGPLNANGDLVARDYIQYELIYGSDVLNDFEWAAKNKLERFIRRLELMERWWYDAIPRTAQTQEGDFSGALIINGNSDGNFAIQGHTSRVEINGDIASPVGRTGILDFGSDGEIFLNGDIYLGDAIILNVISEETFDRAGISAEPEILTLESLLRRVDELENRVLNATEVRSETIRGDQIDGDKFEGDKVSGNKVSGDMMSHDRLFQIIGRHFSQSEIANLAADLGIYVPSNSDPLSMARELFAGARRNLRLDVLFAEVYRRKAALELDLRPNLYELIAGIFNEQEAAELAQKLNLDRLNVGLDANGLIGWDQDNFYKNRKAQTLQETAEEQGKYEDLLAVIKELRPNLDLAAFEPPPVQRYENFDLNVTNRGGVYSIHAQYTMGGEARVERETFDLEMEEIQQFLVSLNSLTADVSQVQSVGKFMNDWLFPRDILALFTQARQDASYRRNTGLRIRLRIEPLELAVLPWEYCYERDFDFLALRRDTPFVRFIDRPHDPDVVLAPHPVRVSLMSASPKDMETFDVADEIENIYQGGQLLVESGELEINRLEHTTLPGLETELARFRPHILHFIGQGIFDKDEGDGALVFENEDGTTRWLSPERLARLLQGTEVKVILLNAPATPTPEAGNAFMGLAPALVQRGIPAVITIPYALPAGTASRFIYQIYRLISIGLPLDRVITEARINTSAYDDTYWGVPVLFTGSPDGVIWQERAEEFYAE